MESPSAMSVQGSGYDDLAEEHLLQSLPLAMNLTAAILAAQQCQICCPIHEWCNADCGAFTGDPNRFPQIISQRQGKTFDVRPPPSVSYPEQHGARVTLEPANMDDFTYTPLPKSSLPSIRLLKILPAVFLDEPINVEIFSATLTPELEYTALSYCWGPPVFDQEIACNGKKLMITETLHGALKRHRQHQHTEPSFLWTDAICINQADKAEVNDQIHIMNYIYLFATTAYIDFGDVEPSWWLGFDLMHKLRTIAEAKLTFPFDINNLSQYGLPQRNWTMWTEYFRLLERPWFLRTWIIQESVLPDKIKCRFGRFLFDWNDLDASITALTRHSLDFGSVEGMAARKGLLNFLRIREIRHRFRNATFRSPNRLLPLDLMRLCFEFSATNPKDKIVGILGLLPPPTPESRHDFKFDYSWEFPTLYHRFASWLIHDGRWKWDSYERTRMLSFAGLSRRVRGSAESLALPSWVPDWRAQGVGEYPAPLSTMRGTPYRAQGVDAAAGSAMFLIPEKDGMDVETARELYIGTWPVDTVVGMGETLLISDDCDSLLTWHNASFEMCKSAANRGMLKDEDWVEAFTLTILVGQLYDTKSPASSAFKSIHDPKTVRESAMAWVQAHAGKPLEPGDQHKNAVTSFLTQMEASCHRRRICITKSGYIALVPDCAALDDRLCIVGGATVPFLFRPREGERHELVGEAYVHGVMQGEAVNGTHVKLQLLRVC